MSLDPFNWNVVILGSWNRAIFTPNKVASKLFELPDGSAIEVAIPMDGMNPTKIIHGNTAVSVDSRTLEISTETNNFSNLVRCMDIAKNALNWLKETPVTAGGYNVRFKVSGDEAISMAKKIDNDMVNSLIDAGKDIKIRKSQLTIGKNNGTINLISRIDNDDNATIVLNFNLNSQKIEDIISWFSINEDSIKNDVDSINNIILSD